MPLQPSIHPSLSIHTHTKPHEHETLTNPPPPVEVIGFTARATATNHTGSLAPFLLQGIFLLLPPVLFAASMYMLYARIVRAVGGEAQSPISLRWATRIFIAGDLICLNVQSSGGGLLGNDDAAVVQIGTDIVIAGLVLQVVVFVVFVWCCVGFHRRFRRRKIRSRSVGAVAGLESRAMVRRDEVPWETSLCVIYGTSMAILFRNVYRVVEFGMGKEGVLQREEWPVYAFDAVPMVLTMVAYIVWHPGALFLEKDRSSGVELVGS